MVQLQAEPPATVLRSVRERLERIERFEQQIGEIERRIKTWQRQDAACRAISVVPGIGKFTATAIVATVADAKTFRSEAEERVTAVECSADAYRPHCQRICLAGLARQET